MSNQPYELSTEKQGHRVLCCCDSRKAVLIISGVALIEAITNLVIALRTGALAQHWLAVISVFFYFLVLWAAINYHRGIVIVSLLLLWQLVAFCVLIAELSMAITRDDDNEAFEEMSKSATITAITIGILVKLVIIYVYGAFISEVGSDVMSPETHDGITSAHSAEGLLTLTHMIVRNVSEIGQG
jgi:cytochrome bd-type quinol oxidase subunit 2